MGLRLEVAALALTAASIAVCQSSQFSGSVAVGAVSPAPLELTLGNAIERGLQNNLGFLVSDLTSETARGQRLGALSALMPKLTAGVTQAEEQLNLKTLGFNFHIPGVNLPYISGPFHYTDVRAYASWEAYDYSSRKNLRAAGEERRAAQLSLKDARDLVVQATANGYLQIIADASRVDAIRAQVETAQVLYDRTTDQQTAGTAAGIDVLRSQVELKQQQQRLLAQQDQLDKDKLALGRVIGLPPGQSFNLAESAPFAPLVSLNQEQALQAAMRDRADYQSYQARVRAAEEAVAAARGERYPTAEITADYGDVGTTLATNSHGTFTAVASARVTVLDGGKISSDVIQAKAALKQRQDELADLAGQIDYEVRAAFLDIRSAADQVAVAQDNLELANQTLIQARDRFTAGVTDNIEVVQAQDSVALANDTLISALFAHNLAKVALARAMGGAEQGIQKLLPASATDASRNAKGGK